MIVSALLDTSYLITLVNKNRANHAVAASYYRHMLIHKVRMHVSTIAISEFAVKQNPSELPLNHFLLLPFNITHAIEAGRLWPEVTRLASDNRSVVRDDVKLIAQAQCENIPFIFTDDHNTLAKWCDQLRAKSLIDLKPILLKDGFDESKLRLDGQNELAFPDDSND